MITDAFHSWTNPVWVEGWVTDLTPVTKYTKDYKDMSAIQVSFNVMPDSTPGTYTSMTLTGTELKEYITYLDVIYESMRDQVTLFNARVTENERNKTS